MIIPLLAVLLVASTGAIAAADTPRALVGQVSAVVDGDTIRIGGRIEKVRYIGINTPEMRHPTRGEEPGAREATEGNRKLVEGQIVRLELDVQERDRYGRLLAYVSVGEMMVNAELVALGYAQVMTIPPNVRYQELFPEAPARGPAAPSRVVAGDWAATTGARRSLSGGCC